MDSFDQITSRFRYNPNPEFSGILQIHVHYARNIHNICIYDNQDVYAKFSLTCNPDETFSTRIINGGGKNPEFNENLVINIGQFDAVLKCEMWMLSRAKNYLEDQLLGFALVPISLVFGKGKVTQDFSLSSTDLFHSPAGTVKLSLSLDTNPNIPFNPSLASSSASSAWISSEVVLLDRKFSEAALDPIEYSRIEFPDINVVKENQQMVSEYFGSFLRLGASDYEMVASSSRGGSVSPNGSIQNSGFLNSTMTSLSDDRNSTDSMEMKNRLSSESKQGHTTGPDTLTSKKGSVVREEKESTFPLKEEETSIKEEANYGKFSSPNIEAEQSAMQQQIVDMYMKSMQQFTESLAKMKLPMDLDIPEADDHGDAIQHQPVNNNKVEIENKKKDGSRVFYGSRAFF